MMAVNEILNQNQSKGLNVLEFEPLSNNKNLGHWSNNGTGDPKACHSIGDLQKDGFLADYRLKKVSSGRYKTELCRPFDETGECKYGEKCQFAHGVQELRQLPRHPKYKTELCRTFHTTGFCPYGPRCHFIHKEEQSGSRVAVAATGSDPGSNHQPFATQSTKHPDWVNQLSSEFSGHCSLTMNDIYASSLQFPYCQQPISTETVLTLAKLINSLNLKNGGTPKLHSSTVSVNKMIVSGSKMKCGGWSDRSDVFCQSFGFTQ